MKVLSRSIVPLFMMSLMLAPDPALAQRRKEKKAARLAESEKPRDVPGGVSFAVQMPADKAFDSAVRYFQTNDIALDESSKKDLGQLITAIRIVDVGGMRNNNKGYRTYVTFIREGDNATTVKVKVTEQRRTKHLQAEPWTEPAIVEKDTSETADKLKAALTAKAN